MSGRRDLGLALCELLGLDPAHTGSITIRCEPNQLPVVESTTFVFTGEMEDEVVSAVERFKLVPVDEPGLSPSGELLVPGGGA